MIFFFFKFLRQIKKQIQEGVKINPASYSE